jgi:excisionase family DNA binding protein
MPITLPEMLKNLALIGDLSREEASQFIGELEALKSMLYSQLSVPKVAPVSPAADSAACLDVPEVARRLGYRAAYVYDLIRRGEFPAIRVGKYVRVRHCDLNEWMAAHGSAIDAAKYATYNRPHDRRRTPQDPQKPRPDTSRTGRNGRGRPQLHCTPGKVRDGNSGTAGAPNPADSAAAPVEAQKEQIGGWPWAESLK